MRAAADLVPIASSSLHTVILLPTPDDSDAESYNAGRIEFEGTPDQPHWQRARQQSTRICGYGTVQAKKLFRQLTLTVFRILDQNRAF